MEMRCCVECGAEFEVNYRAGPRHLYCDKKTCQRKRLTKAQCALRAERRERRRRGESPSSAIESERAKKAAAMRKYRAAHGKYCRRDAARRRRSRGRRSDDGSTRELATVYVQAVRAEPTRLHVVTEGGTSWRVDGVRLTNQSAHEAARAVVTTGEGIAGKQLASISGVVRRNDDGIDRQLANE
jgi:hypothetical protein